MHKATLAVIVSSLLCAAAAGAADLTGKVELGGSAVDINSKNSAKFNEYRDINSGVSTSIDLDYFNKDYFLNLSGSNLGYNTENKGAYQDPTISINGGKLESFKFKLEFDQLEHLLSKNASTYHSGVGTNVLVIANTPNSLAAWTNEYDYKTDRKSYKFGFEGSFKTPFFFGTQLERVKTSGVTPLSGSWHGVTPQRSNFVEFAAPVSYTTDNLYLETGYRNENFIFKLDGLISQFDNDNELMHWQTPATVAAGYSTMQTTSLAPSNDYYKIGGSAMVRLPLNSTLMARANYSMIENDLDLSFPYYPSNALAPTNLHFGGKITYTTASASLTSNPIKPLDIRLFYNFLNKKNESDLPATYGVAANNNADLGTGVANTPVATERFAYHKQNAGFDVSYRLPAKTKVAAGYEYLHLSRALRQDASNTTDHILFAEVKNSYLDALSAKLRYQHLTRSSDKIGKPPSAFNSFGRADAADKTQHAIKAGLDLEPLHDLGIGLEYAFKLDSYDDKYKFSLQDNERHEIYIDANYKIADVTLNGYFNYEQVQSKGNYLRGTSSTDDSLDPSAYTSGGAYPWSSKRVDKNFAYGVNASTDVIKDKATVSVGWRYEKANGNNDLHSDYNTLYDIESLDDYSRQALYANLNYKLNTNMNISCGYAYERLNYSDYAYDGYTNYFSPASNPSYLTGAYSNPNYEAHIGMVKLGYTF